MNPISIEDQTETVGHSAPDCPYRQQLNVLDLLGFSNAIPRTASRAERFALPEEENYGRVQIDLALLSKR